MRVYSPGFDYLYRVTRFLATQEIKRYTGKSILTLVLAASDDAAYYMRKNGWLVMDDGDPYIIKHIEQGHEQITITAYGGHQLLAQRITQPPTGQYSISLTGSADAVAKHFINQSKRGITLVTAAVQGGANISDQSRLKNLGDEVARVLTGSGRGEIYAFDPDNKRIVFDTYLGRDLSRGNTEDNPPVVFDLRYKNIDEYTYTEDATVEQTTVYVGGQGEGVEREIIVTGNSATGNDRVEVFVDARDVEQGDTTMLTERAAQATIQGEQTISAKAVTDAGLTYGIDYHLGDIVTTNVPVKQYAQNGDYYDPVDATIQVSQRITEVVITREGGLEEIDLTFGDRPVTQTELQRLQAEVAQLKAVEPKDAFLPLSGGTVNGPITVQRDSVNQHGYTFDYLGTLTDQIFGFSMRHQGQLLASFAVGNANNKHVYFYSWNGNGAYQGAWWLRYGSYGEILTTANIGVIDVSALLSVSANFTNYFRKATISVDKRMTLQCRGTLAAFSSAGWQTLYTIPVGYRPAESVYFNIANVDGGSVWSGRVSTEGNVQIYRHHAAADGAVGGGNTSHVAFTVTYDAVN